MTRKKLEDTVIVFGMKSAYIAKRNKNPLLISEVRREITENEILGLIGWYSQNKFKREQCDSYSVTDETGKVVLTIKKGEL